MVLRSEILSKMGTNLMRHDLMHRAYEGETCKLIDGVFAYLVQVCSVACGCDVCLITYCGVFIFVLRIFS